MSAAKDGEESSVVSDSAVPEAYATLDTAQKEHAGVTVGSEGGGSGGGVVPDSPSSLSRPCGRYEAKHIYEDVTYTESSIVFDLAVPEAYRSAVFDSPVPAAYATVDTQKRRAIYNSNQLRNPGSQEWDTNPQDGVSPSEGSMSVAGVTLGSEGGGSGGGVVPDPPSSLQPRRYETKNILYEDHELPPDSLKHRMLHTGNYEIMLTASQSGNSVMSAAKDGEESSVVSDSAVPEAHTTLDTAQKEHAGMTVGSEGGGSGGGVVPDSTPPKTRTLVIAFFLALGLVIAVAALVFGLLVFLEYGSSSSSSDSSPFTTPTWCSCPTEEEISESVRSELSTVITQLFENRSAQIFIRQETLSQQMSWLQSNLTHLSNDLASLPLERNLTVPNGTIFDGCTKTPPQIISCDIKPGIDGSIIDPCLSFSAPVDEEGTFLLSAECIITGSSLPEEKLITATLEVFDNSGVLHMRCRCSKIDPKRSRDDSLSQVCSLIATRCPQTIHVKTEH